MERRIVNYRKQNGLLAAQHHPKQPRLSLLAESQTSNLSRETYQPVLQQFVSIVCHSKPPHGKQYFFLSTNCRNQLYIFSDFTQLEILPIGKKKLIHSEQRQPFLPTRVKLKPQLFFLF